MASLSLVTPARIAWAHLEANLTGNIADTITATADCKIKTIAYELPSGSRLVLSYRPATDAAEVVLIDVTAAGAALNDVLELDLLFGSSTNGGQITVTTTNVASGDKVVSVGALPAATA